MNETQTAAVHPLEEMGISREVVQAFDWMGFQNLTAIQQKCIPLMMDGHDIIAIAPTGTGKTLGFGIPMLEYVNLDDSNIQEVVLAPTRELAQQIADELTHLAHFIKGLKIAVIYGGQPFGKQMSALSRKHAGAFAGSHAAGQYPSGHGAHDGAGRGGRDVENGLCARC